MARSRSLPGASSSTPCSSRCGRGDDHRPGAPRPRRCAARPRLHDDGPGARSVGVPRASSRARRTGRSFGYQASAARKEVERVRLTKTPSSVFAEGPRPALRDARRGHRRDQPRSPRRADAGDQGVEEDAVMSRDLVLTRRWRSSFGARGSGSRAGSCPRAIEPRRSGRLGSCSSVARGAASGRRRCSRRSRSRRCSRGLQEPSVADEPLRPVVVLAAIPAALLLLRCVSAGSGRFGVRACSRRSPPSASCIPGSPSRRRSRRSSIRRRWTRPSPTSGRTCDTVIRCGSGSPRWPPISSGRARWRGGGSTDGRRWSSRATKRRASRAPRGRILGPPWSPSCSDRSVVTRRRAHRRRGVLLAAREAPPRPPPARALARSIVAPLFVGLRSRPRCSIGGPTAIRSCARCRSSWVERGLAG